MKNALLLTALVAATVLNLNAGPRGQIPPPPVNVSASLQPNGTVIVQWANQYIPRKREGGQLFVERGIHFSLVGDPFWGSKYSYTRWLFRSPALPLGTTAFVDAPLDPPQALRYRVLVKNLDGVTISSAVVAVSQ